MKCKATILVLLLTAYFNNCTAQLYGAQWVIGPNTSRIDFRNDTIIEDSILKLMYTTDANACICDTDGNLLFYSNGIYVAGANGDSILNGNELSPCAFTTNNSLYGLPIQQAVMFLPSPGNNRYYYLFHFSGDVNSNPGTLYYSVIDKDGNSGLGKIIQKNVVYYSNAIFWGGGMTACKHANGRDWWVIMHGKNNNRFFKFLLTPQGIVDTSIQDIGAVYNGPYDDSYACFSPDGSKYACGAFVGVITVLDFDRCTGEFSSPIAISNMPKPATISGTGPLAFSPSGRFLYLTDRLDLTQYDLWNSNIQDSVEVYRADSTDNAQINYLSLALNGKMYCSTFNGGYRFLHVLNHPDSLGFACGFVWGGQPTLSMDSWNLPNMPNYMLGALIGSGCDTISAISNELYASDNRLHVQPNPADKYLYVETGTQGKFEFELLNEAGQVIDKKETRQVDIFDTDHLAGGVYFVRVIDKSTGAEVASKKVVVVH